MNLFILILIEEFEAYYLNDENPIQNFEENLRIFSKNWERYMFIDNQMFISERKILLFFENLKGPLGKFTSDY